MDEQDLQEQQRLLRDAMRELEEGSTVTADTFFRLNKETNNLSKSIEKAEESIDRFWRSGLGKTTKALGDVAGGFVRGAKAARENRESFESLNPAIEGAANALSAIPIVGDALGKTLSTVGTFVTSELQKSVEAFQTLGSVGGVGAQGVTGLRKSAEQAGLAFDQLAKITQTNAKGLAFATGSTAQGAKAVAQLTSAAEPFRGQLLALGVGITEQSEYFAEYLAMSRRLGRNQSNDYRTLATGAADYVKQLNLLSRLTGESADAMKAELESQQSNVMFRAALRQLPEEIQKGAQNIAAIAGTAGPQFRQGIQDMFGGSMGTEAAKAVFRATGGQARDIIDQYKNRLITQEEAVARLRDATERQRNALGDQFFANAGNMSHAFTDVGIEMYNLADNAALTRENLAKAGIEAALAAEAQDPSTKGMVDAQLALQRFAVEVDKFVNDQVFPNAAGVMQQFTDNLADLAGSINDLATGNYKGATLEEAATGAVSGAAIGAMIGSIVPVLGTALGAGIGGILGTLAPSVTFGGERAVGGPISAGQAYLVGEDGPEMIIPQSSGQVIPADQTSLAVKLLNSGGTQDFGSSIANNTLELSNRQIESRYADIQQQLSNNTAELSNKQIEARYDAIQKGLSDVVSLVQGFKSAFLPGIGHVNQKLVGSGEVIEVKGLDGAVETFAKYAAGNFTARQYTTGDQTYSAGTYNVGDLQANTGYFPTTGPRSMYESMLSNVANPMTDASFQQRVPTGTESYEMKELPLNKEALSLLSELKNVMSDVANNTRTGADTSKKILRASTG